MQEHVAILGAQEPLEESGGSSLPSAGFARADPRACQAPRSTPALAFSFDPLVYLGIWLYLTVAGFPVIMGKAGFRLLDATIL